MIFRLDNHISMTSWNKHKHTYRVQHYLLHHIQVHPKQTIPHNSNIQKSKPIHHNPPSLHSTPQNKWNKHNSPTIGILTRHTDLDILQPKLTSVRTLSHLISNAPILLQARIDQVDFMRWQIAYAAGQAHIEEVVEGIDVRGRHAEEVAVRWGGVWWERWKEGTDWRMGLLDVITLKMGRRLLLGGLREKDKLKDSGLKMELFHLEAGILHLRGRKIIRTLICSTV